ncbi:MAG: peptidoglycan DD-metalloendopeptidase family protein [Rubrivivax sp.]|nr:peptidoglycan DD-metalloendopeptidase family protein [Rubrivivax sp.]
MFDLHRLASTRTRTLPLLAALVLAAGCASTTHRAPVEERQAASRATTAAPAINGPAVLPGMPAGAVAAEASAKPLPGAENAGRPGYYSVKPGDTLIRIGLDNGHNWRDIARWSGLDNPNIIEVGQVLRVVPPVAADTTTAGGAVSRPVVPAGRLDGKPLDGKPAAAPVAAATLAVPPGPPAAPPGGSGVPAVTPAPVVVPVPGATPAAAPPAPVVVAPVTSPAAPRDADEDVTWGWPATGPVGTAFDDNKTKGLAITGRAGDSVLAAADGRVVYAGSGLRGYGNLLIVKHNALFLTAYAHNQALMVKEDQVVRRGQKIAEMGSSEAERVQLHFEIRRQGKPIDPARLLPPR